MKYIRSVTPCSGHRLRVEMESGSAVTADFTGRLNTAKYAELKDEGFFGSAVTDGDYVIWGGGRVKLTVHEVMDVVLFG